MKWLGCILCLACHSSTTNPPADLALPGDDAGACGGTPSLKLTPVASGLHNPTFAAGAPGDPTRLFILERGGNLRVVKDGTLSPTPFLSLAVSSTGDDDGLLGLAFHPQYAMNGRLFVDYSDPGHNLVVAEYARATDDSASPAAVKTFYQIADPAQVRYGGMLAFGPDGYLYIGVGDGAPDGDPQHNALNLGLDFGKILRIDVDKFPTPPPGNFMGDIWDYGLREPWRFSFDSQTHELYLADVGHPTYQSLHIEPAGVGGHNYGWSTVSGSHCLRAGCDQSGITLPTLERTGGCIIGGYVYRGTKNSCLSGWYLYGDWCKRSVRALTWNGSAVVNDVDLALGVVTPSSFGQDADGELYLVDYAKGTVSRFDVN
jgi:glucose/arabinose dehydrogenase